MDSSEIPAIGEGKRGTDGHIAYLLRQASAAVRQRLEQGFAAHKITLPQFTLLTMLKAYPGLSGAELARLAMLTPQTVNVITANLLKRGAIQRVRSGEDKRIFVLSLTEQAPAISPHAALLPIPSSGNCWPAPAPPTKR
ncbi:MarR family winged helix-turn-helix transcriptional regulator [Sphingopyxis sp. BSNA05]|uniref:MarR family winged helix-turn-helix transcriptional regulator n=1 Tax=Sphingopyxis sp. BSNA05 TaxID=1236614 RepID=UPI001C272C0A|nr:MarR family transcriptional regulator [Sphingopyxis sp. BSNA05]